MVRRDGRLDSQKGGIRVGHATPMEETESPSKEADAEQDNAIFRVLYQEQARLLSN